MSVESLPNFPEKFTKAIRNVKKNSNLHFTTADKFKALVIMNKEDYNFKMYELLSDLTTYKKLTSNPLNNVNIQFNKKLKSLLKNYDQVQNYQKEYQKSK